MKIIGVVILILIVMPIILRQLRSLAPTAERHKPLPVEKETKPKKKKKLKEPEAEDEDVAPKDPVATALESLFNERRVPQEKRESFAPLYRRYVQLRMGKVEIRTGSFDLNSTLNAVMTKVHTLDSKRNFEIVFDMDANVPSQLIGDAERIEETLFFLIQNVILKSSSYLIEIQINGMKWQDLA